MSANGSIPQFGERAEPGANDYCFRHKDRVSFTLCQRCGRTICSECQHVSAVGVLCADCVRAAQPGAQQRFQRATTRGARLVAEKDTPIVSYALIAICAVVFVAQLLSDFLGVGDVTGALWYAPLYSLPEIFEPWRMLTSMFTHSTSFLMHILFNMYALWLFGPGLERMLGRAWFLALYLLSGFGGGLAEMLWPYFAANPVAAMQTATVGASGAIFGLLMATLVAYRAQNVNITSLAVMVGINFAIGLLPGVSISWQGHLGGMVVGAVTMSLLLWQRGSRQGAARLAVMAAFTAVLVLTSFAYFLVPPVVYS